MHHCVNTYRQTIEQGRMYIYKVMMPERATLAITPDSCGGWVISQIKGVCNHEVKEDTRQAVREWLDRGNMERLKQFTGEGQ
jgi:hypothetical protein